MVTQTLIQTAGLPGDWEEMEWGSWSSCVHLCRRHHLVVSLSVAVCHIQRVYFRLQCTVYHEVSEGSNSKSELMQSGGGALLPGLLPVAHSACFLIQPKTRRPRVAPPTVGRTFPHQSLIKKLPHWLAQARLMNGVDLSVEVPSPR